MLITLMDEVPGQTQQVRFTVSVAAPAITVRELIRARLELELESMRGGAASAGEWLVVPRAFDPCTRQAGIVPAMSPVLEDMVAVALAGFERGSFLVLVRDRQATALDEEIALAEATEVVFLRLVPLKGG
jgi:hypothetical protein